MTHHLYGAKGQKNPKQDMKKNTSTPGIRKRQAECTLKNFSGPLLQQAWALECPVFSGDWQTQTISGKIGAQDEFPCFLVKIQTVQQKSQGFGKAWILGHGLGRMLAEKCLCIKTDDRQGPAGKGYIGKIQPLQTIFPGQKFDWQRCQHGLQCRFHDTLRVLSTKLSNDRAKQTKRRRHHPCSGIGFQVAFLPHNTPGRFHAAKYHFLPDRSPLHDTLFHHCPSSIRHGALPS